MIRLIQNLLEIMKKHTFIIAFTISILTTFSSCEVVGGIFKAGMGVGIFIVVLVIALILFLVSRMRKK